MRMSQAIGCDGISESLGFGNSRPLSISTSVGWLSQPTSF
jgi:hypothetical protein